MFAATILPEIIILSETWFTEDYQDNIGGYSSFHTVRSNRRSGGVSVFVKHAILSKKIPHLSTCNYTIEVCTVEVEIDSEALILIAIYRPQSDSVDNFITSLNHILNDPYLENKKCIVLGDLNVNSCSDSIDATNLTCNMNAHHFIPLITKPTRFSTNSSHIPSLLDHIWANNVNNYDSGIITNDSIDHLPTFLRIPSSSLNSTDSSKIKISFRYKCNDNMNNFENDLRCFDWESIRSSDVNTFTTNFSNKLNELYCQHFPIKIKYISNKQFKKPWITNDVLKMIKAKSEYFRLYQLGVVTLTENNAFKNKVKNLLKKSKNSYYKLLFERNKNDIRNTWRLIKTLANNSTDNKTIKKLLWNNVEYDSDVDKCEIFNDFFSNVAMELDRQLGNSSTNPLDYIPNSISTSFFLSPVRSSECSYLIRNLKITKQCKDVIPVGLFIKFHHFYVNILTDIINQCFTQATFPSSLKCAYITPIYKKGDSSIPSNYRPISVLPTLSKLIERSLFVRLTKFLSDNTIINPIQFGFTKNKSTQDAIINLTEFMYNTLNSKEISFHIFVDYRKAFDTINRSILFSKLEKYGIRGLPLDLIKNYLSDRKQIVKHNNVFSSSRVVSCGLPQGTILGPLFFLLYVNDMPKFSSTCSPVLFADDTTLSFKHHAIEPLISLVNFELANFSTWSKSNRLSINVEKSYSMIVTNRILPDHPLTVVLNENPLIMQESVLFLGMHLDNKLKFGVHINSVCKKVSKSIGILYKLKYLLPLPCLKMLYYSFVYPYLLYCVNIWGGTFASYLKPLFILQKKSVRIINNALYDDHSTPLFYNNRILKLPDIYVYTLSIYMFDHHNDAQFERNHHYFTRNRNDLLPPLERLSGTQKSVLYNGCRIWNDLPINIREIQCKFTFKKELKNYLIAQYLAS